MEREKITPGWALCGIQPVRIRRVALDAGPYRVRQRLDASDGRRGRRPWRIQRLGWICCLGWSRRTKWTAFPRVAEILSRTVRAYTARCPVGPWYLPLALPAAPTVSDLVGDVVELDGPMPCSKHKHWSSTGCRVGPAIHNFFFFRQIRSYKNMSTLEKYGVYGGWPWPKTVCMRVGAAAPTQLDSVDLTSLSLSALGHVQ